MHAIHRVKYTLEKKDQQQQPKKKRKKNYFQNVDCMCVCVNSPPQYDRHPMDYDTHTHTTASNMYKIKPNPMVKWNKYIKDRIDAYIILHTHVYIMKKKCQ